MIQAVSNYSIESNDSFIRVHYNKRTPDDWLDILKHGIGGFALLAPLHPLIWGSHHLTPLKVIIGLLFFSGSFLLLAYSITRYADSHKDILKVDKAKGTILLNPKSKSKTEFLLSDIKAIEHQLYLDQGRFGRNIKSRNYVEITLKTKTQGSVFVLTINPKNIHNKGYRRPEIDLQTAAKKATHMIAKELGIESREIQG